MKAEKQPLFESVSENLNVIKSHFGESQDIKLREVIINGRKALFALCDGMVNSLQLAQLVVDPIMRSEIRTKSALEQYQYIRDCVSNAVEQSEAQTFEDIEYYMMSGFVVFLLDGVNSALVMGIQGWAKRGIDEPSNEAMAIGAKEGFIESLNDNVALVRKRLKTNDLTFDMLKLGEESTTGVSVCYLKSKADKKIVEEVKRRLQSIPVQTVIDFGCLQPYLDTDRVSLFSGVGNTERPDTLAAKLLDGRVGVMVDGTPFVMIVPYLFSENFQSLDDYDSRPFYATFIRLLKYFSFILSILLPGLYVAVGTFHQELLPSNLLFNVAVAEMRTPFSLMVEAIIIFTMYEIMREAGLRLPKSIGHAVSIIGAIVIGEATVSAGLIGAPMLIVVALTAISSYVVYPLYEPVAILRLIFIILGGVLGIYGIMVCTALLMINLASIDCYGIPYTAPIAPFDKKAMEDTFVRVGWKTLNKHRFLIQKMRGVSVDKR